MTMYAVAGVTGNTGKVVAETLLGQGHPVRVIVRDAARAESLRAKGAQVAVADLSDRDALAEALRGVQGAYLLLPPRWDVADPVAYYRGLAETLREAVREAQVPHVVLLSSVGAQHESGTGPIVTVHHAERALRPVTALTALRPAYFVENWASVLGVVRSDGVLPSFIATEQPVAMVSTVDIGQKAAGLLLAGPQGAQVVELSGPSETTPAQIAQALSSLLERAVTVAPYPPEAAAGALQAAGLPQPWAALYQQMYVGLRDGRVAFEGAPARGTEPLSESLRRLLG
jgi:uncharacterized protein YbjT (DUF2867 family)